MGPMGPMSPALGCGNGTAAWLVLAALLILLLGLTALVVWGAGGMIARRGPRSPEEALRERFARGAISRQQYREALVEILKDHYIRGELELDEYETRLDLLLREPVKGWRREQERPAWPPLHP